MTPRQGSLLSNWVLVGLALALAVAVVVTSRAVTSGERQSRARHLLTAFRSDDVSRVTFEQGGQRWVIDKGTGDGTPRWSFVEPLQGEAEEATLDQLLRAAQFATWLRRLDGSDVDRKGFGLEPPSAVLGIEMGTLRYRLELGGPAPAPPGAHYAAVSGEGVVDEGVYVVSQSTAEDLNPDPEDFRIRQLIPYAGSELERLEVTLGDSRFALVRQGRSGFRFDEYLGGVRLGRISTDQMLLAFSRTRAQRFLPLEQGEQLQVASGALLTLRLQPANSKRPPAVVTLGAECPEVPSQIVAVRSEPRPAAACIEDPRLHSIFEHPEWLADRSLLDASVDEVERLTIAAGDARLTLARVGDGFELREPKSGKVDADVAEQRMKELLGVRGVLLDSRKLDEMGLDPPWARVTLERATSDPDGDRQVIELSRANADGEVFARRLDDGAVLQLGRSVLRLFEPDDSLLRGRQLLELQAKDVRRVSVEHDGRRWVLQQPARGEFAFAEPAEFEVDAGLAVAWVDAVRQLEVERWVAAQDDGSFGLQEPRLRFVVEAAGGERLEVVVGGKASGGYYARREAEPGVFVLSSLVVRTLERLIIDRSGFHFDPDLMQSLSLRHGETSLELVRLGSEVVQQGGSIELAPSQVTALLDALGSLHAQAAMAFDAGARRYDFSDPVLDVRFTSRIGGESHETHYQIGAGDYHDDMAVFSARLVGNPVVYAIPRRLVSDVLGVL